MIQEDKDLLLKDLCARLPYGVKVEIIAHNPAYDEDFGKIVIAEICGFQMAKDDDGNQFPCVITCYDNYRTQGNAIETIRIYLRPMSSMTEEEKKELHKELDKDTDLFVEAVTRSKNGDDSMRGKVITHYGAEWCDKNHFDYRGLIEKGLALEAPEGLYK